LEIILTMKIMRKSITSIVFIIALLLSKNTFSQVTVDVLTDYYEVLATQPDSVYKALTGKITFKNKRLTYDTLLLDYGIHFKNNTYNFLDNDIESQYIKGSSIIGVHGPTTTLELRGSFKGDVGQSENSIVVMNGGKFVLGESASVDFILPVNYFTRQFWVSGDGTGIFETAEGFVADLTNYGTIDNGIGSMRFANTIFVTHHNRNHPLGYRPGGTPLENGTGAINSHLVFEKRGGSVWRVMTNDQNFRGGLWVAVDMCIQTISNLELSGVNSYWSDYTNYGGLNLYGNLTLCKLGAGELLLSAAQTYGLNSKINIQEGVVNFATNPTSNAIGKNGKNTNDLTVYVQDEATLKITSDTAQIKRVEMLPGAIVEVDITSVFKGSKAIADGVLKVNIPAGVQINQGDIFNVFSFDTIIGAFDDVIINNYSGAVTWNTDKLLVDGTITLESGTITSNGQIIEEKGLIFFPNPSNTFVFVKNANERVELHSVTGKLVAVKYPKLGSVTFDVSALQGIYILSSGKQKKKLIVSR